MNLPKCCYFYSCRYGNRDKCEFYDITSTTMGIGTTSLEATTTRSMPNLDGVCDGLNFNFLEHPSDCSKAIFCFYGQKILRQCPDDMIFDINIEE